MKRGLYIFLIFISFSGMLFAQPGKRASMPKLSEAPKNLTDSLLLFQDSSKLNISNIAAYRLSDKLGESYLAPMDTFWLNEANSKMIEGRGLAVSYLANIGSPAQSRIFSERDEDHDFIFANAYNYYITTPQNALFYDVKDPYTQLTYTRAGGQSNREEMFNGVLTTNFGKKVNIGADFDYTYVHGQYTSNANKMLYYRIFGNYLTDKYEMHAYFRNFNYLNTENGGLTNDSYITNPDDFTDGKRKLDRQAFPTRFTATWNRNIGGQFFLTHRYNLGFYREMTAEEKAEAKRKLEIRKKNEELKKNRENNSSANSPDGAMNDGHMQNQTMQTANNEPLKTQGPGNTDNIDEIPNAVFVPVSSIIHTFEYEKNSRRFLSESSGIDTCYEHRYGYQDSALNDQTRSWNIKNTIGLSLREGFQDWAKFGLTAYVHFEKRRFTLPGDSVVGFVDYDEFSTYLGAELSKRRGKILTYNARGEFCLVGSDIGEFRLNGELQTQFKVLNKDATIKAEGYIKNLTPAFYLRHNHSRYFWWDNNLKNTQRVYVGGKIGIEQTKTTISAGVESLQNFIYFGNSGTPEQYGSNLQVVSARLRQDFIYKAFGWENEVAYQISSEKDVLPLPQICAYSNIYLKFKYAKVLNIQLGADAHYFTSYYAPYYEPATQQFQTQNKIKVGNYPIINAYANFYLKQARFFISAYNIGSLFITPTEYFSLPHYPLNPMTIRLGISVYFNN